MFSFGKRWEYLYSVEVHTWQMIKMKENGIFLSLLRARMKIFNFI